MVYEMIYVPNDDTQIYPSIDSNLLLKLFKTQLNEQTNQKSMLLSQRIRKRYHKTLGTSVINSPLSTFSLGSLALL